MQVAARVKVWKRIPLFGSEVKTEDCWRCATPLVNILAASHHNSFVCDVCWDKIKLRAFVRDSRDVHSRQIFAAHEVSILVALALIINHPECK